MTNNSWVLSAVLAKKKIFFFQSAVVDHLVVMPTACYDECLLDDKYIREHYFFSGACCASKTSRWVLVHWKRSFSRAHSFFLANKN